MISNGWETHFLGDICSYSNEKIEIEKVTLDNYISTENMIPEKGGVTSASTIPNIKSVKAYSKDEILISNIRPYFKKIWYADRDGGASNDVLIFKCNEKIVHNKYLYYFLSQDRFFDYLMATSKGTKMPRGDKEAILRYSVHLPSLIEQKSIANIFSSLDKKIEINNQINKKLEEMTRAIFKHWFVDFKPFKDDGLIETECGSIPKSWNNTTLDKCCDLITKGITPKYVDESKQRVINQKCIRNNKIDLRLVRFHKPKKINEKWLQYGDILINSTGQGTLGRVAQVLESPINLTVDSHITIVRPKKKQIIDYLGCLLLTKQSVFEGMASGSTGQTDLPRNLVKTMKVVLPCEQVLEYFSEVINPLRQQMILLQNENIKLEILRDTLLPKLMSGEIRVPIESN